MLLAEGTLRLLVSGYLGLLQRWGGGEGVVLLESGGSRPGMLLSILRRTGQFPATKNDLTEMSAVLVYCSPALGKRRISNWAETQLVSLGRLKGRREEYV